MCYKEFALSFDQLPHIAAPHHVGAPSIVPNKQGWREVLLPPNTTESVGFPALYRARQNIGGLRNTSHLTCVKRKLYIKGTVTPKLINQNKDLAIRKL